MIFDRGDRFADKAVEDNREYIVLPSVISKTPTIKIVDDWRQSPNSSSSTTTATKIPVLNNSSSSTLSYDINRSTLSTKGGALSHAPKFMEDELRHSQSAATPGPASYGQLTTFISPSHNARVQPRGKMASSLVEESRKYQRSTRRPSQQHRKIRSISLPEVHDHCSTPSSMQIAMTPISVSLPSKSSSMSEQRRELRRSLQTMLLPLAISAIVTDTPTRISVPTVAVTTIGAVDRIASPVHFVTNPIGTLLTTTPRSSSSKDKPLSGMLQSRTSSISSVDSEEMPSVRLSLSDDPMALFARTEDVLLPGAPVCPTTLLPATTFQPQPPSAEKKQQRRSNSFRPVFVVENHPPAHVHVHVHVSPSHAPDEEEEDGRGAVPRNSTPPSTPLEPLSRNISSNMLLPTVDVGVYST